MKKIFIAIFTLLMIGIIGMFIYLESLSTEVGYVVSTREDSIRIIRESVLEEIESKQGKERMAYLDKKAEEPIGTVHDKKYLTVLLGTNFKKGDKVKAYWSGITEASAPGHAVNTVLIRKLD